jgi:predicted HTH domain antitoxin
MPLPVSDELLQTPHLSEAELLREIAVTLFQQDRLTLAQAASFAEITQLEMQRILASRRIPLHYGLEDLEQDLDHEEPSAGVIAVSDTSPILNLCAVGRLELLRRLFGNRIASL